MIYGRCGQPVVIKRRAVLADVKRLDGRRPDARDKVAIADGSYVVAVDDGAERLYHQAFLRADRGSVEISEAIAAVEEQAGAIDPLAAARAAELCHEYEARYPALPGSALRAIVDEAMRSGHTPSLRELRDIVLAAEEEAHGRTFGAWLAATGRSDSASDYDLRAAWRAGEDPEEYRR